MDKGKFISFGEGGMKVFGGEGEMLGVWVRGALKNR